MTGIPIHRKDSGKVLPAKTPTLRTGIHGTWEEIRAPPPLLRRSGPHLEKDTKLICALRAITLTVHAFLTLADLNPQFVALAEWIIFHHH